MFSVEGGYWERSPVRPLYTHIETNSKILINSMTKICCKETTLLKSVKSPQFGILSRIESLLIGDMAPMATELRKRNIIISYKSIRWLFLQFSKKDFCHISHKATAVIPKK